MVRGSVQVLYETGTTDVFGVPNCGKMVWGRAPFIGRKQVMHTPQRGLKGPPGGPPQANGDQILWSFVQYEYNSVNGLIFSWYRTDTK